MYIMFPIGWMYYFGTNEERKFAVPDFWPKTHETHRIPFEREDLKKLSGELKVLRLMKREERRRKEAEEKGEVYVPDNMRLDEGEGRVQVAGMGRRSRRRSIGPGSIDRWASGEG